MHSAIVAHQSPVLEALVHGNFREAIDRSVEWEDIDEPTFRSFWQYAYSGSYGVPDDLPIEREVTALGPEERKQEPVLAEEEMWSFRRSSVKKRKIGRQQYNVWDDFRTSWRVDMTVHDKDSPQDCRMPKDAAEIFIHHAKVYILADCYSIPRLIDLSFQELHKALMQYSIADETVDTAGVVKTLRFCCTRLVTEKLRKLMGHYAA